MEEKKLSSLYNWFDMNRAKIIGGHENEKVLISDYSVIEYFKDEHSALKAAKKAGLQLGNFLVQWCIPKDEEYWYCYNQEVSFV